MEHELLACCGLGESSADRDRRMAYNRATFASYWKENRKTPLKCSGPDETA